MCNFLFFASEKHIKDFPSPNLTLFKNLVEKFLFKEQVFFT